MRKVDLYLKQNFRIKKCSAVAIFEPPSPDRETELLLLCHPVRTSSRTHIKKLDTPQVNSSLTYSDQPQSTRVVRSVGSNRKAILVCFFVLIQNTRPYLNYDLKNRAYTIFS